MLPVSKISVNLIVVLLPLIFSLLIVPVYSQSYDQVVFSGTDDDEGYSCLPVNDGYILTGSTESYGNGNQDAWIMRVNEDLEQVWAKTVGGATTGFSRGLILTSDEKLMTIGESYRGAPGLIEILVKKFTKDGILEWAQRYGGSGDEEGYCLIETPDKGFIMGGSTSSSERYYSGILIKIDSIGNLQWSKKLNYVSTLQIFALTIYKDKIIIVGRVRYFDYNILVGMLDLEGNPEWIMSLGQGEDDFGKSLLITEDDEIVVLGQTTSESNGDFDICLLRIDSTGNIITGKKYGTPALDAANNLLATDEGFSILGYSEGVNAGEEKRILMLKTDRDFNLTSTQAYGGEDLEGFLPDYSKSSINYSNEGGFIITGIATALNKNDKDVFCTKTDENGLTYCEDIEVDLSESDFIPEMEFISPSILDIDIIVKNSSIDPISFTYNRYTICPQPPVASFTSDKQEICINELISFTDLSLFEPLSWEWYFEGGVPLYSSDQNPQNILYQYPGSYDVSLKVNNDLGSDSVLMEDFIVVHPNPVLSLGGDTTICIGDIYFLSPPGDFDSMLWQDGYTGSEYQVTEEGVYNLQVWNENGCTTSDSIYISYRNKPEVFLGNDTVINPNTSLLLDAGQGMQEYYWHDGSTDRYYTAKDEGIYWVNVWDGYCYNSDTIVIAHDCEAKIFVPNAFTPNNDGLNDEFHIVSENIHRYRIRIFSRWGDLVFESNDIDEGWEGSNDKGIVPQGSYIYIIDYRSNCTLGKNKQGQIKGTITLLR